MPDDKRPSTPPANKDSLLVQDTPLSQGSGSHSSFRTENRQTQYKPYLIEDLKSQFFITLDDFFTHILKIQSSDLKQKPLKVADQKRIDDAFDRYGALGKKDSESSRYYPFITLANLIISSLTGTDWPTFCRNDPIIIQGSSAERKPDVVLLPPGAVDGTKRGLADELLKGPEKMPFYWSEVLAYLEFKLGEPRMESYEIQELAMPSGMFDSRYLGHTTYAEYYRIAIETAPYGSGTFAVRQHADRERQVSCRCSPILSYQ